MEGEKVGGSVAVLYTVMTLKRCGGRHNHYTFGGACPLHFLRMGLKFSRESFN